MAIRLGRVLCAFGRHKWDYRLTFFGGMQLDQCSRCCEMQNVPGTPEEN